MNRVALSFAVAVGIAGLGFAATPVAVWDGDFTTLTKGTFTLSENGNTKTDSYLQISGDNGITVTSTDALNVFTVIMRCSGLNLAAENAQVLFTSYASDSQANLTGYYLLSGNSNTKGIWNGADWSSESEATKNPVPANYTTLIYNHQQTNGTYGYALGQTSSEDDTVVRTTLYSVVGLRSSGTTYHGFNIGGLRGTTSTTLLPATGLKITSIAVFSGTLTEAEMKTYAFPSEWQPTPVEVTSDTTVSAINGSLGNYKGIELAVSDGVAIAYDAPFTPISVRISSTGNIKLAAKAPPSAAELAKLDLSGVQGSVVRTWLNPGVVGFNFNADGHSWGSVYANGAADTSSALADGDWFANGRSKNGSETMLFSDGLTAFSWSSANVYANGAGLQDAAFIQGYLDDGGSGATVTMSRIPYETYDVIIYASTDTADRKFSPKTVNGKTYTCGSDGVAYEGNAAWGASRQPTAEFGTNAMIVKGLSGPLTVNGGANASYGGVDARGGIAAIQIMPAGVSSGKSEIVIDATEGWTTTDSDMLGSIRTTYRNVRVLGSGQYGATLNFGYLNDDSMYISSHIVFDGGTHAVTISGANDSTIGSNASEPILEVLDGTTLDFYQHDLSGWLGSAAAKVPTCNIQVDDGGQLNIKLSESGTTYYQGRYTIYPGATVTSYVTTGNDVGSHLRFNGGAVQGAEQIYVPATTTSEPGVARFNGVEGNTGIFLASDETAGLGIFVGGNSTLEFDLDIAGVAGAPLSKWGEGTLNLNGNMSSYQGTLTVHEGTVNVGTSTTLANVVNDGTLTFAYGATISAYSGAGNVVVDVSPLVDGGAVPSGSYTLLPGGNVDPGNVEVIGLPDESGFSVHITEDGIVLTDAFCTDWTGPSGSWTETTFDGRTGSTDGKFVYFANSAGNDEVTVTVAGDKSVAGMAFVAGDTAYTLTPGQDGDAITSSGALAVSGLAPVRVETPLEVAGISLAADTEFTYANTALTIPNGALTGSGKFILDPGAGNTYTMSSANTSFTGEAVIASGTVKMGDLNSFGSIGDASRYIRVCSGATLDANHAAAISTAYTVRKNQVLLEEGAVFTSSTAHNDRKLSGFQVVKLDGDASIRADEVPVSLSLHYNYYPSRLELGNYTLSKTGTNELYLSSVAIEGTGTLDILAGYVTIVNSYLSAYNTSTFTDGTLKIAHDAGLQINFYNGGDKGTPSLTVKNLELDGSVTREKAESALTVTGYVTGNGTTPMLTLGANAVFKPTGTGYLTITESLTLPTATVGEGDGAEQIPYMVIDLTDALDSGVTSIPLFKVGSAENLPAAEYIGFIYPGQTVPSPVLPRGWKLSNTLDGCGYKLSKGSFSIRLR